jgi:hypothetical protein
MLDGKQGGRGGYILRVEDRRTTAISSWRGNSGAQVEVRTEDHATRHAQGHLGYVVSYLTSLVRMVLHR